MASNLLHFHLENDFGDDLIVVANNEIDLEEHLNSLGYTDVRFYDLQRSYGTCTLKNQYGTETAKCYYVKKI